MSRGMNVVNGAIQQVKDEPTYEESVRFQAKLIGIWEQQQQVLGYTAATIALNLRNLNEILDISDKFIWELEASDMDMLEKRIRMAQNKWQKQLEAYDSAKEEM